jgi:hypothetical protein
MGTSSQSLPLFERSCQEALSLLSRDTSDKALALVAEARDLLTALDRWKDALPTTEDRAAVLSRVLDLNRAVMEHLTRTRRQLP